MSENTNELGERLVNICPHAITIIRDSGRVMELPRADYAARITTRCSPRIGTVDGVPIMGPEPFRAIVNLPRERTGTFYIVSQLTALAAVALEEGRRDLLFPATGPSHLALRSADGKLLAVRELIRA